MIMIIFVLNVAMLIYKLASKLILEYKKKKARKAHKKALALALKEKNKKLAEEKALIELQKKKALTTTKLIAITEEAEE